ncbi:MAG TPA: hypothetical protein VK200_07965 [Candidatus Limnocylindrales bacterium]|nr:hypothetical protein [Candidatus Limnocylindrales bacterium]
MSQLLGKDLPPALLQRLSGGEIDSHEGKIIPILTIDESGWAHPALLSYYEIVAKNSVALDMALWKDSSTAKNLRRSGKITIMITDIGLNYYLKGTVQELEYEMTGVPQVSRFRVTLEEVLEDQESYAQITSGLTYVRQSPRGAEDFATKVLGILREER